MASPLEKALEVLVSTFQLYSSKEGDKSKLKHSDMKELLLKELPGFMDKKDEATCQKILSDLDSHKDNEKKDEATCQKILCDLDTYKDREVNFQEFVVILGCLAMLYNEPLEDCLDEMPRSQ